MGWILAVCISLVVWTFYWPIGWLGAHVGVPIAVTAALLAAAFFFHRRRARAEAAAAKALGDELVRQGEQQVSRAPRDRRAEIEALQQRFLQGLSALEQSRAGGKRGASALSSLPLYLIIGPPGAGKTTAIEASGLEFPFSDADGAAVRGIGGTRNCDWWFTSEAILLDSAGRYTTESDDHEEWIAFLQLLRSHRRHRPLNGVLVAISVADLADASEKEIERHGKQIRARIDEVMTRLGMIVPVYVLFTKADLIAGFAEIFGDLKKSDRKQAWGATLPLATYRADPRALFESEMDELVRHAQARSVRRLAAERMPRKCDRIYQFPLELAGIRSNLADFLDNVFALNPYQGTPIFRGFYFTSGTQEGRPLDRVLQRMSEAMDIPPAERPAPEAQESKSYFLHDVFVNVVFKDADIAVHDAAEIRRRLLAGAATATAALAISTVVCAMAGRSFVQNRELLRIAKDQTERAQEISWRGSPSKGLTQLEPLLQRLKELDTYREEGAPSGMGWGMYQGDRVHDLMVKSYLAHLEPGFVLPCKGELEERLRAAKGERYTAERLALKAYLMLDDSEHGFTNLDVEWATGQYTDIWLGLVRAATEEPEADLRRQMTRHVRYYFTLLKEGRAAPVPLDRELIARVRRVLGSVPVAKRYYDQYVGSVAEERAEERAEDTRGTSRAQLRYPGVTLPSLFAAHPDVVRVLHSLSFEREGKWRRVEGPYTEAGHYAVVRNVATGKGLLEEDAWVVPLGPDETPDRAFARIQQLANDYEARYMDAWTGFLSDVTVRSPRTLPEAVRLYRALSSPPWPYLQLLHGLEDHTQWPVTRSALHPAWEQKVAALAERRVKERLGPKTGLLPLDFDVLRIGDRGSAIPALFGKAVGFGVPLQKDGGSQPGRPVVTGLAKYVHRLDALRHQMERRLEEDPRATPEIFAVQLVDAMKEAEALVAAQLGAVPGPGTQDPAAELLQWLWCPLQVGNVRFPASRLVPAGIQCL